MSLKAKLEAVIYAAEEPVTLAQLAVLFAGEALAWKAAREAEQAPALPLPEEAVAEAAAESLASPPEEASADALVEAPAEASEASEETAFPVPAEASSAEPDEPAEPGAELPEIAAGEPEIAASAEAEVAEAEEEADSEAIEAEANLGASVETASVGTPSMAHFEAPAADSDAAESSEPAPADLETASSEGQANEPEALAPEAELEAAAEPVTPADPNSELVRAVSAEEAEFEARRQERRRDREARETLRMILDELIAEYASDARGIEIREIAGGYRMGTKPEMHDAVRAFVKSLKPPLKLSLPALETLAVIAYKQPVTAPEVGEIRGVDSAGVLGSLMSRKLIATAGRKQVVGRPMLYKTTREFLLRFGLKDISELPSMEEFEKMAAQELSDEIGDEAQTQSDLFAESETATVPGGEASEEEPESAEVADPEAAERESGAADEATIDSSAESVQNEAQAPNENEATGATPDGEEIEVPS